jgi:hypothetical protein
VAALSTELLGGKDILGGCQRCLRAILLAESNGLETGVEACGVRELLQFHAVDTGRVALDRSSTGEAGNKERTEYSGNHSSRWWKAGVKAAQQHCL